MQALLQGLNRLHFQPKAVDDVFSKEVYSVYLKDIDNSKRLFTQADINQLKQFEMQLDDQANSGTFEFFDLSLKLFDQALPKTQGWYKEFLSKPMDFSKNDLLEADGEKLDWAKDDTELRARWEKWMRFEVLSRIVEEEQKQEKADFKGEKKNLRPTGRRDA